MKAKNHYYVFPVMRENVGDGLESAKRYNSATCSSSLNGLMGDCQPIIWETEKLDVLAGLVVNDYLERYRSPAGERFPRSPDWDLLFTFKCPFDVRVHHEKFISRPDGEFSPEQVSDFLHGINHSIERVKELER